MISPLWGSLVLMVGGRAGYSLYHRPLSKRAAFNLEDLASPTASDRVLVFSPHQDDETLAAGGYIASSVKSGASVSVVLVTDGNRRGLEYVREDEFIQATGALGVPEDNLIFLNYPDGKLKTLDREALKEKLSSLVGQFNPTIILSPHPNDYNKDHSVIGSLISELTSGKSLPVYFYLVHYPHFPVPVDYAPNLYLLPPRRLFRAGGDWRIFMLSQEIEDEKKRAVDEYKTQLGNPFIQGLLLSMIRKNEIFLIKGN